MSSGPSDWVNLFVHQGKEFIDSVSGQRKRHVLVSEAKPGSLKAGELGGVSFANTSLGAIKFEKTDNTAGTKDGGSSSSTLATEASNSRVEKMSLTEGEKDIYENQLEQLQEQLVDIMIKNQEMDAELTVLRDSDVCKLTRELEREKIKRKQVEAKLKRTKSDGDSTPKLRRRKQQDALTEQNDQSTSGENQTTDNADVVCSSQYEIPEGNQTRFARFKFWAYSWYMSLTQRITMTFWNIISDLSDEETVGDAIDEDGPPLAVKTLKDNINRFSTCLKPIKEFFKKINWVLSWKNPAATMLIFLVYVFSFWHGFTVSLLLFLGIVQLSANFVYSRFGTISDPAETETPAEPPSWSDRFQVILHVARKVQNILGSLSEYLEKIKNLLTWKVLHVTLKLYVVLWLLFVSSMFLSGPQFFTLLGVLLGSKLFVINPLYNRFPKLKRRYDTTHRLWVELPTDCEIGVEDKLTADLDETPGASSHRPSVSTIPDSSAINSAINSKSFCERYRLTSDEVLVKGWEEGWRTSLMNKHRPLVNIKHGRLYLTQNYLCFERSRTSTAKNILIKLSDIRCVNKYKPLFILPGTGMSIEVCMKDKDEMPYIFGAMVSRDDAYNDIVQTARKAELPWAM